MNITIYGIKNVINDKIYIGSTKNYKSRKNKHLYELKKGTHSNEHLQRSYNKHGKDKFHFYVIEECEIENDFDRVQKETYYISKFKSHIPEYGFNIYEPSQDGFVCNKSTVQKIKDNHREIGYSIPISVYSKDLQFLESFDSINDCARKYKINSWIICQILKGLNNRLTFKGMTFFYKNEEPYLRVSSKQRDMNKKIKEKRTSPLN